MTKTTIRFVIILLIAIIVAAIFYFIPSLEEQELNTTFAIASLFTVASLGAVWYFLSSLRSFKVGLR